MSLLLTYSAPNPAELELTITNALAPMLAFKFTNASFVLSDARRLNGVELQVSLNREASTTPSSSPFKVRVLTARTPAELTTEYNNFVSSVPAAFVAPPLIARTSDSWRLDPFIAVVFYNDAAANKTNWLASDAGVVFGAFGAVLAATATRASAVAALSLFTAVSASTPLLATDRGIRLAVTVGNTDKTITLPALTPGDAGWPATVYRVDKSYGKLIVTNGAGYTQTIRIRGTSATYVWNGTAWTEENRYGPLQNQANPNQFGSGTDGDAIVAAPITLTGDAYYNNLTITAGGQITTSGYRIFVNGDLDLRGAPSGSIRWNGANGNNGSGATGGSAGSSLTGNTTGGSTGTAVAGANGGTGTGAQATNITSTSIGPSFMTNRANESGAGGSGGSGAGGAARAAASQTATYQPEIPIIDVLFRSINVVGGSSGQAGSSGAGDGVNSGGGGGGNGKGGGMIQIYARRILVDAATAADAIQAKGGNGGNGGNSTAGNTGGGGGSAGGTGGAVFLVAGEIVGSTAAGGIDVTGGNGGNGGTGQGTGSAGTGGDSGSYGRAVIQEITANAVTVSADSVVGNANVGATGGIATTTQIQIAGAP